MQKLNKGLPGVLALAIIVSSLISSSGGAQAQQLQMLPPTVAGGSSVCPGSNSLLFFSGNAGNDPVTGKPISAINCMSGTKAPVLDPTTGSLSLVGNAMLSGDLWLGSANPNGVSWDQGTPEIGPAIHFSGNTGQNSDSIFMQRWNLAKDISVLALTLGDNAQVPYGSPGGDAFQIGAYDSGNNYVWVPRYTFTADGTLSVGSPVLAQWYVTALSTGSKNNLQLQVNGGILSSYNSAQDEISNCANPTNYAIYKAWCDSVSSPSGVAIKNGPGEIGGFISLVHPLKTADGTANMWNIYNMQGNYGNSLQFWSYDTKGCHGGMCASRFTITDDGRVGIGTMTPYNALDVAGKSIGFGDVGPWYGTPDNSRSWMGYCPDNSSCSSGISGPFLHLSGWTNSNYGVNSGGSGLRVLTLNDIVLMPNAQSKLGVGTVTPAGTLDVENGRGTAQLCLNGNCVTSLTAGSQPAMLNISCPAGAVLTGIVNNVATCTPLSAVSAASTANGPDSMVGGAGP